MGSDAAETKYNCVAALRALQNIRQCVSDIDALIKIKLSVAGDRICTKAFSKCLYKLTLHLSKMANLKSPFLNAENEMCS